MDFNTAIAKINQRNGFDAIYNASMGSLRERYLGIGMLMPIRVMPSYNVETSSMTVRTTMAGAVALDAPYPQVGAITARDLSVRTAKIACQTDLNEGALRQMQDMIARTPALQTYNGRLRLGVEQALNFYDRVLLGSHQQTWEFLTMQALSTGAIDWTFNGVRVQANYEIPTRNQLDTRTGTAGYGGADSVFWDDVYAMSSALNSRTINYLIADEPTANTILNNPANRIRVAGIQDYDGYSIYSLVRQISYNKVTTADSSDMRDRMTLVSYRAFGEILNPNRVTAADPLVITKRFIPEGRVIAITLNPRPGFSVTSIDYNDNGLGYTHLGPTVEGDGVPGVWGRIYTPEPHPMMLSGQMVSNVIPAITNASVIAHATTELPA